MGKKNRKTRWRTLAIAGHQQNHLISDDSDESTTIENQAPFSTTSTSTTGTTRSPTNYNYNNSNNNPYNNINGKINSSSYLHNRHHYRNNNNNEKNYNNKSSSYYNNHYNNHNHHNNNHHHNPQRSSYSSQSTPIRRYQNNESTKSTRSSSTASENKITFNEDEYTRITTPRQDVLFKKGYLNKPKTYQTQTSTGTSTTSTGNSTGNGTPDHQSTDLEYESQFVFPNGFVDQNGIYYVNSFEPYPLMVYNPPTYYPEFTNVRQKRSSTGSLTDSTSPHNEEVGHDSLGQNELQNGYFNVVYSGFYFNNTMNNTTNAATVPPPGVPTETTTTTTPTTATVTENDAITNSTTPKSNENDDDNHLVNGDTSSATSTTITTEEEEEEDDEENVTKNFVENGKNDIEDKAPSVTITYAQLNNNPKKKKKRKISSENHNNENDDDADDEEDGCISSPQSPPQSQNDDEQQKSNVVITNDINNKEDKLKNNEENHQPNAQELLLKSIERKDEIIITETKYDLKPDAEEFVPRAYRLPHPPHSRPHLPTEAPLVSPDNNLHFVKFPTNFVPIPIINPSNNTSETAFVPLPINFIPHPVNFVSNYNTNSNNLIETEDVDNEEEEDDDDVANNEENVVVTEEECREVVVISPQQPSPQQPVVQSYPSPLQQQPVVPTVVVKETTNQIDISKIVSKLEEAAKEQNVENNEHKETKKSETVAATQQVSTPPTLPQQQSSSSHYRKSSKNYGDEKRRKPIWRQASLNNFSPKHETPPQYNRQHSTPSKNYSETVKKFVKNDHNKSEKINNETKVKSSNQSPKKMDQTTTSPIKQQKIIVQQVTEVKSNQWIPVSNRKKRKNRNVEELNPDEIPPQDDSHEFECYDVNLLEDVVPITTTNNNSNNICNVPTVTPPSNNEETAQEQQLPEEKITLRKRKSRKQIKRVIVRDIIDKNKTDDDDDDNVENDIVINEDNKKIVMNDKVVLTATVSSPVVPLPQIDVKLESPPTPPPSPSPMIAAAAATTTTITTTITAATAPSGNDIVEKKTKKKKKKSKSNLIIQNDNNTTITTSNTPSPTIHTAAANNTTTVDDSYDFLLETSILDNTSEKTNVEISQELDKMIQRGIYSNLEEKIKSLKISESSNDGFFENIMNFRSSRESSVEKNLYNKTPNFSKILLKSSGNTAATTSSRTFISPTSTTTSTGNFLGKNPPDLLGGSVDNTKKLLPITEAVKEWLVRTRETTPEVEILKSPETIRREFEQLHEKDDDDEEEDLVAAGEEEKPKNGDISPLAQSRKSSSEGGGTTADEITIYTREGSIDILEYWDDSDVIKTKKEKSPSPIIPPPSQPSSPPSTKNLSETIEVYDSKYGRNEDYLKIKSEIEQLTNNKNGDGGTGVNFHPKHGNLPYRAICCSIM